MENSIPFTPTSAESPKPHRILPKIFKIPDYSIERSVRGRGMSELNPYVNHEENTELEIDLDIPESEEEGM